MAVVRQFGFLKNADFIMWPLLACQSASSYKISLKSDNRLMNYGQKKMAAAAILNFKHFNFWSRGCHSVQYLL